MQACAGFPTRATRASAAEVEAAVAAELARVAQKGVTEEMVARGRQQVLVSEVDSRRTVSGQASRLGQGEVVLGDLGYPQVYFQRLSQSAGERLGQGGGALPAQGASRAPRSRWNPEIAKESSR